MIKNVQLFFFTSSLLFSAQSVADEVTRSMLLSALRAAEEAAQSVVPLPIDLYLNDVLHGLDAPDSCHAAGDDVIRPLLEKTAVSKIDCGKPFSSEIFCKNVYEASLRECKSKTCMRPAAEVAHYTEAQRRRVFRTAKAVFESLIADPNILGMCCGQSRGCIENFKQIKLNILKGLPEDDVTAHYKTHFTAGYSGVVEVSEARMLKCEKRECMERCFLHELGHGCMNQRIGNEAYAIRMRNCSDAESSAPDFEATMGVRTRQCVQESLKSAASRSPQACQAQWGMEAFADMVFSAWWTRPAHWGWSCNVLEDLDHADRRSYMPCIFQRAAPRQNVCAM